MVSARNTLMWAIAALLAAQARAQAPAARIDIEIPQISIDPMLIGPMNIEPFTVAPMELEADVALAGMEMSLSPLGLESVARPSRGWRWSLPP